MAHDPHATHASADDEYLNPASGSGHEHTDANVWMIVQFAVWLTVSAVIVHILMWFMFRCLSTCARTRVPPSSRSPSNRDRACRPVRDCSGMPANEISDFHRREDARARRLQLDRSATRAPSAFRFRSDASDASSVALPSRPADAALDRVTPRRMMPTDSSAGRKMERRRQ